MHTTLRLFALPLLLLAACGVDRSAAPPVPTDPGPAEGAARVSHLALVVDGQGQVHASAGFVAARGCPVLPGDAVASLNGQALAVVDRGHGEWQTGRACTSSPLYPSFCSGEPTTTLACRAPRLEGTLDGAALTAPLVLETSDGQRAETFTFPVALGSLQWKAELLADGALRLRWQGGVEPELTRAIVVRAGTPAGEWQGVVEQRSRTELVLPAAARWAGATIELTTFTNVQERVFLQVEARQAVELQ